jgi:hypothetical protein
MCTSTRTPSRRQSPVRRTVHAVRTPSPSTARGAGLSVTTTGISRRGASRPSPPRSPGPAGSQPRTSTTLDSRLPGLPGLSATRGRREWCAQGSPCRSPCSGPPATRGRCPLVKRRRRSPLRPHRDPRVVSSGLAAAVPGWGQKTAARPGDAVTETASGPPIRRCPAGIRRRLPAPRWRPARCPGRLAAVATSCQRAPLGS